MRPLPAGARALGFEGLLRAGSAVYLSSAGDEARVYVYSPSLDSTLSPLDPHKLVCLRGSSTPLCQSDPRICSRIASKPSSTILNPLPGTHSVSSRARTTSRSFRGESAHEYVRSGCFRVSTNTSESVRPCPRLLLLVRLNDDTWLRLRDGS